MSFDVKRKKGHPDPRMLVGGDFGKFFWCSFGTDEDGEKLEVWQFEMEAARAKFIKQYGGEEFTLPVFGVVPADPVVDDYFWSRK